MCVLVVTSMVKTATLKRGICNFLPLKVAKSNDRDTFKFIQFDIRKIEILY